jgi:hypothetical protein
LLIVGDVVRLADLEQQQAVVEGMISRAPDFASVLFQTTENEGTVA